MKYYAVSKIRNDRKRREINTIHREVIKSPIFKDITKDRLKDRVDKLLKNGALFNKPNRDKDSLRINRDKINDPSINISSLSTHSLPAASPATYLLFIQTQTQGLQIHHHRRNYHLLYLRHQIQTSPWTLLQLMTMLQVISTT